jgi:hypothetical protein
MLRSKNLIWNKKTIAKINAMDVIALIGAIREHTGIFPDRVIMSPRVYRMFRIRELMQPYKPLGRLA